MTCVWDALRTSITQEDLKFIDYPTKPTLNAINMVKLLKNRAYEVLQHKPTIYLEKWNNEKFTDKYLKECYQFVKNFNVSSINRGYDCSSCDPFLMVFAGLFRVNVHFIYVNTKCLFQVTNPRKTLKFQCSKSHFYKK